MMTDTEVDSPYSRHGVPGTLQQGDRGGDDRRTSNIVGLPEWSEADQKPSPRRFKKRWASSRTGLSTELD